MSETYTPANLRAGDFPIVTEEGTVVSGENILIGALLGRITGVTNLGKLGICTLTASDGRQTPYGIALSAADATLGDVTHVPIALTGEFNSANLSFGPNTTFADVKSAMRALGLYGKTTIV